MEVSLLMAEETLKKQISETNQIITDSHLTLLGTKPLIPTNMKYKLSWLLLPLSGFFVGFVISKQVTKTSIKPVWQIIKARLLKLAMEQIKLIS